MTLDERRPGRLDRGTRGELERDLACAGELALDGEETDPDANRHQTRTPAPK